MLSDFAHAGEEIRMRVGCVPADFLRYFGYPKDQALKVAIGTISSFLLENEMTVYVVIFDRKAYQFSGKLFADIASYIWPTGKNPGAGSLPDWAVHGWVQSRGICSGGCRSAKAFDTASQKR